MKAKLVQDRKVRGVASVVGLSLGLDRGGVSDALLEPMALEPEHWAGSRPVMEEAGGDGWEVDWAAELAVGWGWDCPAAVVGEEGDLHSEVQALVMEGRLGFLDASALG